MVQENEVPPQYGLAKLIVLHLAPGALATVAYVALIPLTNGLHWPAMCALLFSAVVALVPIELGHLLLQGKKRNGRWSLDGIVLYRGEKRGWPLRLLPLGLFLLAIVGYELTAPMDRLWQKAAFSWLPSWYVFSDLDQYAHFSQPVLIGAFSARLVLDGLLFPVVEELYFRGYLLPRMARLGWAAPFLNCLLFSAYHFWQPYNLPTIFFVSLPMVLGVWVTKDLRVGIYTHVLLNTVGGILAMISVLHGT